MLPTENSQSDRGKEGTERKTEIREKFRWKKSRLWGKKRRG
jgi:hypothetical protein